MADTANQIEICAKTDVDDGAVIRVDHDDLELAVYHVDGVFYVTDNVCTHGPGELSEGFLEGHVIECDFHQGKFDIRDGAVVAPPCIVAIKTYKVIPHDSAVVIEVS
ncbi:MAG: non-heme iron oxygenase ferredoxin subunit [Jannaschia sp.]